MCLPPRGHRLAYAISVIWIFFKMKKVIYIYIYIVFIVKGLLLLFFFFLLISSHFEVCDWEPRRNSGTRLSIDSRAFRSRRGFGCSRRSPYQPAVARLVSSRCRSRRTELIRQKWEKRRYNYEEIIIILPIEASYWPARYIWSISPLYYHEQ